MQKIKNQRIVPTSNDILKDRTFSMETFLKFQIESNRNDIESHRYIKLDSINYTQWSKDLGISIKTLKKNIQLLIIIGVLQKFKADDGQVHYTIQGRFEKYKLFDERFIRKLLNVANKNLIKIYLVYYKYSELYGVCLFEQKDILEQIGMTGDSGKNIAMLKDINDTLLDLGLIEVEKISRHKDRRTKTMLKIKAVDYTKTKFYKDATAKY